MKFYKCSIVRSGNEIHQYKKWTDFSRQLLDNRMSTVARIEKRFEQENMKF